MSAHVERLSPRKYLACCDACQAGLNAKRQVDAHIWASAHNSKEHAA